jgi:hypothetical protein
VYLITEGNSSDQAREILRDNIFKTRCSLNNAIPLHVVSLFCHSNNTQVFLRSIADTGNGTYVYREKCSLRKRIVFVLFVSSYFSYNIKHEVIDYKTTGNLYDPTRIQIQNDRVQFGTNVLPPQHELPMDVTLMYKEFTQCQNIIDQLEKIMEFIRTEDKTKLNEPCHGCGEQTNELNLVMHSTALLNNNDACLSSNDWLKTAGIDAKKLDFFSVLQAAAFRHCDGIVNIPERPNGNENNQHSRSAVSYSPESFDKCSNRDLLRITFHLPIV